MTGFSALFDTGCQNTLRFNLAHILESTVTTLLPLLGSGLQHQAFPFFFPFPYYPRTQLPASNSSNSQQLNRAVINHTHLVKSRSQSYLTTDGQSASLTWCHDTIRALDQFLFLL
jgi:hypothetical protein